MVKMNFDKYMRSTIVLAIDTITSLIASVMVLLFCYVVLGGYQIAGSHFVWVWLIASAAGSILAFYFSRVYRLVIRFSTLREFTRICMAVFFKEFVLALAVAIFQADLSVRVVLAFLIVDYLITVGGLLVTRSIMLTLYWFTNRKKFSHEGMQNVLVYGVGEKAVSMVTRLRKSTHYFVWGFIVPGDSDNNGNLIMNKPIYHFEDFEDFKTICRKTGIGGILFPYHADARAEQNRLVEFCREMQLKMYVIPSIDEITDGRVNSGAIRKIRIEDLLGRSEIEISIQEIRDNFQGKSVLVTGAAGSIGSELCRQLARLGVKHLIMYDNAETPLHNVRLEFEEKFPSLYFTPIIGDVRHVNRLDFVFRTYRPDIVFHAAAYKHVPLMEENPCEAVLVNVQGSRNVADKCVEYDVGKMVMVSTDKAVNPTNIMGCTKRLAEIYVQSLGIAIEKGEVRGNTTFVTTRFGNVLGSNGSVIPRFAEQIEKGGPVTVTDPEIRRFFMTIPEACRLVMKAATMATGTQIFVFDMGVPVKISDLAKKMISLAGFQPGVDIEIQYTGLRPGEKLYEEVLATKENTLPTEHERIFVAKVREYSYTDAVRDEEALADYAREVDIPQMVIKMKNIVTEFKSRHSEFEKYDK